MKKFLFILTGVLIVFGGNIARADDVKISDRRFHMVQNYVKQRLLRNNQAKAEQAEQFLKWVQGGTEEDLKSIAAVTDISLFSATDKFGNNCFHLAKEPRTFQTLAGTIRKLDPKNYRVIISNLRNGRNDSGESPLMTLIRYGNPKAFHLVFDGSALQAQIHEVQSKDTGGILSEAVASGYKATAIEMSKDNAGQTVAQAAVHNQEKAGMGDVIAFFQKNAPYLF